jgi:hypothetical protein
MPKKFGTPGPRLLMPTVCTSVPLASCCLEAQLLFDRLIAQADDQGRMQGEPRVVAALCMPLIRSATERRVAHWLAEIAAAGLIARYESEGRQLIQLLGWWENQGAPRRAYPSRYPAPDGWEDNVRVDGETPRSAGDPPPVGRQPAGNSPPERRQTAAEVAALARAGPSLPVPSLPVPSRPNGGGSPTPTWLDAEAPEGPALVWLAEHGAATEPNGNGLHRKLCGVVEGHGSPAVIEALEKASVAGARTTRQFVFALDDLLDPPLSMPREKAPDPEEQASRRRAERERAALTIERARRAALLAKDAMGPGADELRDGVEATP